MSPDDAKPEQAARLVQTLVQMTRGEATLSDLADALRGTSHLVLAIPPAEGARFSQDLDAAVKEKGIGNVMTSDTENPRVVGATGKDGFVPRVFTSEDVAMEYATARGLIEPGELLMSNHRDAKGYVIDSLNEQYGGWVIDEGTEHAATLDAPALRRLYALLALEDFARLPALHLVGHQGRFVERLADGAVQALVFDSERTATIGIQKLRQRVPGVAAQQFPVLPLLARLLGAGVTRLMVNNGFTTERWYARDELETMVALLGGDAGAAAGQATSAEASSVAAATADPALQRPPGGDVAGAGRPPAGDRRPIAGDLLAWARRYSTRPVVPPPGRPDAESQRVFRALRERVQKQTIGIPEYLRLLAYDVDLYVQPLPKPLGGLLWPQPYQDPDDREKSFVHTYTREATMREAGRNEPPEMRAYHRLSGIELMRWVWATPKNAADEIYIDAYKGTEGYLKLPSRWALSVIYPLFAEVESLESVPSVGLARVTGLAGARALHAEVARALLQGWKHLLGTKARAGGAPVPVEHDGGHRLPAFTTDDQFFAYGAKHRGFDGVPVRADSQPPFGRWLAAARDCDGVVLDPAAPRPLTLDHTDLLALDLWSRESRQPRAADLVKAAAQRLADGTIVPRTAARVVADWPAWYLGVQRTETGLNVLRMPQADALPIFASERTLTAFVSFHTKAGSLKGLWEALPVLHRWTFSVFHEGVESYADGAWFEPAADATGGLHVDGDMLQAALERVHERLTPRVPGFVAGA